MSESYGRIDGDALNALKALTSVAGDRGRLSKSAFLREAYQDVNMALCRSNAEMYRKCNQQLAKVSGSMFQRVYRGHSCRHRMVLPQMWFTLWASRPYAQSM